MRTLFLTFLLSLALWAEVGKINLMNGNVTIQRAGQDVSATIGTGVEEHDVFITGPQAFVKILFNDSTVIIVGKNSTFQIQQFNDEENQEVAKFKILKGVLESTTGKIGKIAPDKFNVITRTSKIGVRGTVFQVLTNGTDDTVSCTQGSISVTELSTGITVLVAEGEMTAVSNGSAPSSPTQIEQGIDPLSAYQDRETQDSLQSIVDSENSADVIEQIVSDAQNAVDTSVSEEETATIQAETDETLSQNNDMENYDSFVANVYADPGSNTAPSGLTQISGTVNEDSTVTGSVSASDADGDTLTYSLTSSTPTGLTFNSDGSWSFDASSYDSLGSGGTQTITFDYAVSDGTSTVSESGSIIISGVNDAPTGLSTVSGTVNEDSTVTGSVSASDADGDTLTYSLTSSTPTGLTFNSDGSWSFDASSYDSLASGGTQTITFDYAVSDGTSTVSESGSIIISGVNDAPTGLSTVSGTVNEDSTVTGSVSASDADGDTLTYSLTSSTPTGLTFNSDGSWSFDAGSYDSLASGGSQTITFDYQVSDGTSTASESGSIVISGVNDAPTYSTSYDAGDVDNSGAISDSIDDYATEPVSFSVTRANLLSVVSDAESETLSISGIPTLVSETVGSTTDPTYEASVSCDATQCTFTLQDDVAGADIKISYDVTDGTDTITVYATVDVSKIDTAIFPNYPGNGMPASTKTTTDGTIGTDGAYKWGWWLYDAGFTGDGSVNDSTALANVWVRGPNTRPSVVQDLINNYTGDNYVYEASSSDSTMWGRFQTAVRADHIALGSESSWAELRMELDFGGGSSSVIAGNGTDGVGSYFKAQEPSSWGGGVFRVDFGGSTSVSTSGVTAAYADSTISTVSGSPVLDTLDASKDTLNAGFYGSSAERLGGYVWIQQDTSGENFVGGFLAPKTSP